MAAIQPRAVRNWAFILEYFAGLILKQYLLLNFSADTSLSLKQALSLAIREGVFYALLRLFFQNIEKFREPQKYLDFKIVFCWGAICLECFFKTSAENVTKTTISRVCHSSSKTFHIQIGSSIFTSQCLLPKDIFHFKKDEMGTTQCGN